LEASTLRRWLWRLWQVGRPRRELFLEVTMAVVMLLLLLLLLLLLPPEQVLQMLHSFRKLGLLGLHAVLLWWCLLRLQQLLNGELSNTRLLLTGLLGLLLLLLKLIKDRQACWLTIALSCRLWGFARFQP